MRKIRVMLENPHKPENIGTVMRNIYAFNSGALIVPKTANLILESRSACGTGKKVSIQKVDNTTEFLKKTSYRKIGFVVQNEEKYKSIPITDFNSNDKNSDLKFKDNDLLIFGNEAEGLTVEAIELCDKLITIPMLGHKGCLNLAVSTGITLYEVLRQKIERKQITIRTKPKKTKFDKIQEQMEKEGVK